MQSAISYFKSGTHNRINDELIPSDAATDSLNWLTRFGHIELIPGRQTQGGSGLTGKNYGEHTAFRVDGVSVRFRKVSTKVQTLVAGVWTDVITGLAVGDVTFVNYQSLAGAFVYIFDPLNDIYKIAVANPTSYTALYDATKNFKGYAFIDKGRTILWGVAKDPSGLYGSWVDGQNSTVYTTITGEVTAGTSGTLAFKGAGATRTCFGVAITITTGGQVYTDDYNGKLVGNLGGTGTINYTTGAWTVTAGGAGTATYQWENSNAKGVTDFTKSVTRLAGEGFVVRQDAGGDAIKVVMPFYGSYFSLKSKSCYRFTLDVTDVNPQNIIFRTDIGVSSLRCGVSTGNGIIYMNTANPSYPELQIISQNPNGDNFDVNPVFPHFDWGKYTYNDAIVSSHNTWLLIGCSSTTTGENDRLIFGDMTDKKVDVSYYGIRTLTKDNGILYGGDPVSDTTYELLTGFDDNGIALQNYWISKGEMYVENFPRAARLRYMGRLIKTGHLQFRGFITPDQNIQVYFQQDNGDYQLVGTISGNADYVDFTSSQSIGTNIIGVSNLGGTAQTQIYPFLMDMKIKVGKFRKRNLKLVATGIGYAAITNITDDHISFFDSRLPKKYRNKQNVSLDGQTTNLPNPSF